MRSLKKLSCSETETMNLGKSIWRYLKAGDIVCLFGCLGAGKTILVKGMAKACGIKPQEIVSPTFVLIREYLPKKNKRKMLAFYHFDLYRLNNPRDILDLGYEEYFYGQGISVVEWAEKLKGHLPREFLKIDIQVKDEYQRIIRLSAKGKHYRDILTKL